jgi:DNA-binding response OmpR family regulator
MSATWNSPDQEDDQMTKERVLVVDDDRDFAESIAMRCRSLGLEAETATTPLAAVMDIASHPPDLLCLDVNLPTGNGLDLCEYLMRDSAAQQTPVIVLTGDTDRETIFRSAMLRTRYLYKSTDTWQQLRPLIEKLLPRSAA